MTADTARIGPQRQTAPATSGDIVISIDAMGGDRGVAGRGPRHGQVAEEEPPPALHPARRRRALARSIRTRHARSPRAPRCATPSGVIAMDDKPSRALRSAQGTSMWNALETVKSGESPVVISCGNTGALMALADARAAQGAGRRPAGDRRALALAEPRRLQRAARRRRRHPRRRRRPAEVRGDGRLLRPQRAGADPAAGRACSTSAPRSTRAAPSCTRRPSASPTSDPPATSSTSATSRAATCRPTGST